MPLIGTLIDRLLTKGSITFISPGREPATFGPGGGKALTVRAMDRRVPFEIARNPRLGAGETYMDGRLIIEDGTILDLLGMITGSNAWENGGSGRKLFGKSRIKRIGRLIRRNDPRRSRRNVAHHYDL